MIHARSEADVRDVAAHAGGVSPGVGRNSTEGIRPEAGAPGAREGARAGSLIRKVASVAAGMVGLAAIGLVAGAPKSDRMELMNVLPQWGEPWLAGSAEPASPNAAGTTPVGAGPAGAHGATPNGAHGAVAGGASETAPAGGHGTSPRRAEGLSRTAADDPATSAPGAAVSTTPSASGTVPSVSPSPGTPPAESGITPDGKVILNRANAAELTRLPGVGAKRAEKILELRTKLGRFSKPSDLLRVKGIGPKGLQKMLPHLVLDPPEVTTSPTPEK